VQVSNDEICTRRWKITKICDKAKSASGERRAKQAPTNTAAFVDWQGALSGDCPMA
jgi:hypothetical protein